MAKENIDILEKIPFTLEDINENPIFRPLSEFWRQTKILEKDERIEIQDINEAKQEIQTAISTKIYEDSIIVRKFQRLVYALERNILTMTKYMELSDEKILEMKKIIEQYYLTKKEHESDINEYKSEIKKLKENIDELKLGIKDKNLNSKKDSGELVALKKNRRNFGISEQQINVEDLKKDD
jgi:phage gp36-like protein